MLVEIILGKLIKQINSSHIFTIIKNCNRIFSFDRDVFVVILLFEFFNWIFFTPVLCTDSCNDFYAASTLLFYHRQQKPMLTVIKVMISQGQILDLCLLVLRCLHATKLHCATPSKAALFYSCYWLCWSKVTIWVNNIILIIQMRRKSHIQAGCLGIVILFTVFWFIWGVWFVTKHITTTALCCDKNFQTIFDRLMWHIDHIFVPSVEADHGFIYADFFLGDVMLSWRRDYSLQNVLYLPKSVLFLCLLLCHVKVIYLEVSIYLKKSVSRENFSKTRSKK